MGIMGERCKCHVSLAIAYSVHGPSQELGTPRGRSEAGRIEGGQAFACWIGDYRRLLSVVEAAHSRIAISPSCRTTATIVWVGHCVAFPKQGETDAAGNLFRQAPAGPVFWAITVQF